MDKLNKEIDNIQENQNTESIKSEFIKKLNKKISLKVIIICLIILAVIVIFVNRKPKFSSKSQIYSVEKICELATLECYYHDVAEYRKDATGIFNYGYKKYWIEYNGIVKYGVDAKNVKVTKPNQDGVVQISVPEAKVLSVSVDKNSMSDPIVDTGIFTSVSIEEKNKAYNEAQQYLKTNAENDSELLGQARNNAKKLIEQYIIGVGKRIDKQYTVEWIEE